MANILLITPFYKIEGRDDIVKDTEAVHYLVKYWNKTDNVYVIYIYVRKLREITKLFNKKQLKWYVDGYDYNTDGVDVTLIERFNLLPGRIIWNIGLNHLNGLPFQKYRILKKIKSKLKEKNFVPDKILVHFPLAVKFFINDLDYDCEKIAVLHMSDLKRLDKEGDKFIKYLNKAYSRIYCRSKAIYNKFNEGNKLLNLKEDIIYSGISNDEYFEKKFKDGKRNLKFLYVGKLTKRKNLDVLIKALAKFDKNDWSLEVIGDGVMKEQYIELVDSLKLNDNVAFLGRMPKDEVYNHMRLADVFCMVSVDETFGLVYLEAMSNGCITIATKREGIDGVIINNENGYLIEPNVSALTDAIKGIFDAKKDELNNISKKAVSTAKYYSEENASKMYYDNIFKDND